VDSRWIGYLGLISFSFAWIPQSWQTVRAGRCDVNTSFLALAGLGSLSLAAYAFCQRDPIFSVLNAMTGAGALLNLYFGLFPREAK